LIDRYGATNPAEFFAVVTETFFEKPTQLRKSNPDLYQQMQLFYRQGPEAIQQSPTRDTDQKLRPAGLAAR
jgi:Mlc titration factor MtfA (ptsG expression regulator)